MKNFNALEIGNRLIETDCSNVNEITDVNLQSIENSILKVVNESCPLYKKL